MIQQQAYRPNPQEVWIQKVAAEVARKEAQLLAEEQEVAFLVSHWFPAQIQTRQSRFAMEVGRLHFESQQRRAGAMTQNIVFAIFNVGRPQYTPYQEELFLLQATERLRQQLLREEEMDRSRIEYQRKLVFSKKVQIQADVQWLKNEYQTLLSLATTQPQKKWLNQLPTYYPHLL